MTGLSSLAQASTLLDMSAQALGDSGQEVLQPADMVSLMQLLSLAADTPTESLSSNRSQQHLQEMSQNFIRVADSLISQGNTSTWQAIKEVGARDQDPVILSSCHKRSAEALGVHTQVLTFGSTCV